MTSHGRAVSAERSSSSHHEAPTVSVIGCQTYELGCVRQAVIAALSPLGGIGRFVRPGMQVLLKPNLLRGAGPERAVTTHPAMMQAVASLVREAGGNVLIGDSPGGLMQDNPVVMRESGAALVAEREGACLVPFDQAVWRRLRDQDYHLAPPALEADLMINLPKLKTHAFARYTGAVKNLFGVIPGRRKREYHCRAPGIVDFGQVLVDLLELVRPGLTILDGVLGQEGNGPGMGGTPHLYGCVAASHDPVALDAVIAQAMGYRAGEVIYLDQAATRGLGVSNSAQVRVVGDRSALQWKKLDLPAPHWYFRFPSWVTAPFAEITRVRPRLIPSACVGCGSCAEVCPKQVISRDNPPTFDLKDCVGCLCCAEICPQGAIEPKWSWAARLIGIR